MGKVITVLSTKGGVGKSTLTRYLGMSLEEMGFSICIIDLCQNGSIATGFLWDRDSFENTTYNWLIGDVPPSKVIQQFKTSGVYFIPSDETIDDFTSWAIKNLSAVKRLSCLREKVAPLKEMFDFVLIDTHPSENSDLVSYAIAASDYCLVPMEVDLDSKIATIRSVEIIKEFMGDFHLDYGIVPNKVSARNGKVFKQFEKIKEELINRGIQGEKFFSCIRFSDLVPTSKNESKLLCEIENKYAAQTMNDFRKVSSELVRKLKEMGSRDND